MSDFKDYGSNRDAIVLEGAYKGIVAKIEDARERICRELDAGNQQDLSAYESMMEGIKQGVESLLSEFRFVSQQNSAIYEFQEETRKNAQNEMMSFVNTKFDSVVSSLNAAKKKEDNPDKRNDELSDELSARLNALSDAIKMQYESLLDSINARMDNVIDSVNTRVESVLEEVSNRLNDSVGSIVVSVGNRIDGAIETIEERANSRIESISEEYRERLYSSKEDVIRVVRDSFADMPVPAAQQEIDYEYLADRVSSRMSSVIPAPQEIDYEYLADRVASRMSTVIPAPQEIDYEYLADRVAARLAPAEGAQTQQPAQPIVQTVRQEVDYDLLAAKLSEKIKLPEKEERGSTPIVMFDAQPQPEQYPEAETRGYSEESFDYDVLAEKIASILPETDYDMIAEKVAAIIPEVDYDAIYEHVANAVPQTDYDAVADKVASCIPLTDYDLIAERVAEQIGTGITPAEGGAYEGERVSVDTGAIVEAVTESVTEALSKQFDVSVDEEGLKKLADAVGQVFDYDAFAQKVADLIRGDETDLFRIAQETPAPAEAKPLRIAESLTEEDESFTMEESSSETVVIDYNAIAERVVGLLHEEEEERARVAEIARQEAERLRREEELAKKEEERAREEQRAREEERLRLEEELAKEAERARLAEERAQEAERIREEELARKEEERLRLEEEKARQEEERARLQEELAQIAERVRLAEERAQEAERIREEELARQEEERLRQEEEKARQEEEERIRREEELARREEELARQEEERLRLLEEERARQEEERARLEEERRLAEMLPAQSELTEVAESDEKEAENEFAAAIAVRSDDDDDDIIIESSDDPTKTVRYKRSFLAKIIQSDEDTKKYYGDLKNTLLSYEKVHSQISWSNDRITKGRETIAKIGIRGKTLCVYLALDPDEFPITVYHQDYAGDTKMYEKTPLLMQIKSHVALKRTIKLIEIMMTKGGTEKIESFQPVDYKEMYSYRSDEALLDEGLIKTSMMKKVDFNF